MNKKLLINLGPYSFPVNFHEPACRRQVDRRRQWDCLCVFDAAPFIGE